MRRHVFYCHGFDPRGPAPYHAIMAEAAATRGFEITPRRNAGAFSSVWEIYGAGGVATVEFLRHDDLVRVLWPRWNGYRRHMAAWRGLFAFISAGTLAPLARFAPSTLSAVWLQALMTLTPIVLALGLGFVGWRAAALAPIGPYAVGGALAAAAAPLIWRWLERQVNVPWFTRSLVYLVENGRGEIGIGSARAAAFADRIVEVWRESDADEVLVVGHSAGAMLAVETLALALERAPDAPRSRLALLTLGQSIPISALLDRSGAFAPQVEAVAAALRWTDITSCGDPASSGTMPISRSQRHRVRSLPTGHIDEQTNWRKRLANPLEFHFSYLRAQNPALGFDFLTALVAPAPPAASRKSVAA